MPASRFGNTPLPVQKYDVLGTDATSPQSPRFLGHAGLAGDNAIVEVGSSSVSVTHMRPPLELSGNIRVDCVGSVGLTDDEQSCLDAFVAGIDLEYRAAMARAGTWGWRQQYIIHPHTVGVEEPDGTETGRRFSCVGFVIEAYRDAGIVLLNVDPDQLPRVTLDTLKMQYPSFAGLLVNSSFRDRMGISGEGPWPVLLVGYLFHSLSRSREEILRQAYVAQPGDELFPSSDETPG